MELETRGCLPSMYEVSCIIANYIIPETSRKEEREAFSQILYTYLRNIRRRILKEFLSSQYLERIKYQANNYMNSNRTFIINGNYYENNAQLNTGPVQYNIDRVNADNSGVEDFESQQPAKDLNGTKEKKVRFTAKVLKLAELIDEAMFRQYKNCFNKRIAPYIISEDKDPMKVIDMKFVKTFKKDMIYSAFSDIFNYVKDDYDKWDMAKYMHDHLENMPKVDSIYRKI